MDCHPYQTGRHPGTQSLPYPSQLPEGSQEPGLVLIQESRGEGPDRSKSEVITEQVLVLLPDVSARADEEHNDGEQTLEIK